MIKWYWIVLIAILAIVIGYLIGKHMMKEKSCSTCNGNQVSNDGTGLVVDNTGDRPDNDVINRIAGDRITQDERNVLAVLNTQLRSVAQNGLEGSGKINKAKSLVQIANTSLSVPLIFTVINPGDPNPPQIQNCDCNNGRAGLCWQWNGVLFVVSWCRGACCNKTL